MANKLRRRIQIGAILTVFGAGYLCGTVTERRAIADMNDLRNAVGGAAAKEAAGGGGGGGFW